MWISAAPCSQTSPWCVRAAVAIAIWWAEIMWHMLEGQDDCTASTATLRINSPVDWSRGGAKSSWTSGISLERGLLLKTVKDEPVNNFKVAGSHPRTNGISEKATPQIERHQREEGQDDFGEVGSNADERRGAATKPRTIHIYDFVVLIS